VPDFCIICDKPTEISPYNKNANKRPKTCGGFECLKQYRKKKHYEWLAKKAEGKNIQKFVNDRPLTALLMEDGWGRGEND
jgi:hypothetical protein